MDKEEVEISQLIIEKKMRIMKLVIEVDDLLVSKFFDIDSDKLLDEKIEVLTALKNGKVPGEIPNYYDILELMPKPGVMWD